MRWTDRSIIAQALSARGAVVERVPGGSNGRRLPHPLVVAAPLRLKRARFGILYGSVANPQASMPEVGHTTQEYAERLGRALGARA